MRENELIIGYIESGEIQIYSTEREALRQWAAYSMDILSEVVIFYTIQGKYLEPSPVYEDKKWYQMNASISAIALNATDPESAGKDSLIYLLENETTSLKPNIHISSLEELIKKVKGL